MKGYSQLDLLILGLREPQGGMEKHFVKVMRAEASPHSSLEREWYEYWKKNGEKLINQEFRHDPLEGYGICSECGEDIPDERLEAIPGCSRCIACQTKLETLVDVRAKADGNSFVGNPLNDNHGYSRDDK